MFPPPSKLSGGNLNGGKKKLTPTISLSSSLVTPPPAIKKEGNTHSGGVEVYNSEEDDSIFQSIFQAYEKDCEESGWTLKSDKVASEQKASSSKPKGKDLAFDHSSKKPKSERTFEDEDSSDDDFLKLYKSIEREKLSTEQSQSVSNNSEAHARSLTLSSKKKKTTPITVLGQSDTEEEEKEEEEEDEEGSSRLVDGYIGMDGEWHPASEDDDDVIEVDEDELQVEVVQEVRPSAAKMIRPSAAKKVRPYAATDFMAALRKFIREGVLPEDFLERLRDPVSIQMLKMMEKRNRDRLYAMVKRVRNQDYSCTVYIPDWVVPFLQAIAGKERDGDELLFAGIGTDRNDKLIRLIKAACVEAGSEDVEKIGSHSGRKTFGDRTLKVTQGDMRASQQLLGHASNLNTTLYTSQQPKHMKEVVRDVATNLQDIVFGASHTTTSASSSKRLLSKQNPVLPSSPMDKIQFGHYSRHGGRRPYTEKEIKYMLLHAWTDEEPHIMHLLRAWIAMSICSGLRVSEQGRIQVKDVRAPDGSIYCNVIVKWTKGGLLWHQEELLGREAPHLREQRAEETAKRLLEQGREPDMRNLKRASTVGADALIREGFSQGDLQRTGTGARDVPISALSSLKRKEPSSSSRPSPLDDEVIVISDSENENTHMHHHDESDDDEGFLRRSKKPAKKRQSKNYWTERLAELSSASAHEARSSHPTIHPSSSAAREPSSSIPPRFSRAPTPDDPDKYKSLHASVLDPAIPDRRIFRIPFTNLEVYAILDGYHHRTSSNDWAGILRDYKDYFHPIRTSVSIKDKVRNMVLETMTDEQIAKARDHFANLPDVCEGIQRINAAREQKLRMSNELFLYDKWTKRSRK
jgi:integrase